MSKEEAEGTGDKEKFTPTPAEEKAMTAGWKPEKDWTGEPGEWVTAENFNFRGELMGRISEQSSIINHLETKVSTRDKAIEDLQDLQHKISETAYKEAMRDLKAQKVQALDEDNNAKVVQLDDEIQDLKANKPVVDKPKPAQAPPDTPKEVVDWLEAPANQWYNKDEVMRSMADGISNNIMQHNPNITPQALLKQLDATIRKELPHKFPSNDSSVDTGNSEYTNKSMKGNKLPSFSDLSAEQQAVAKRFVAANVMTKKEYIEELVKVGEL